VRVQQGQVGDFADVGGFVEQGEQLGWGVAGAGEATDLIPKCPRLTLGRRAR
jgi:hypothetical protein